MLHFLGLGVAHAASLLLMVCGLTLGREKFEEVEEELKHIWEKLIPLKENLVKLVDEDSEAFNAVMSSFKLPKETDGEKASRQHAIQSAFKSAADTPLKTATCCAELLDLGRTLAVKGNPHAISDVGVAALMAVSGLHGAVYNVKINLSSIKDGAYVASAKENVESLIRHGEDAKSAILKIVDEKV